MGEVSVLCDAQRLPSARLSALPHVDSGHGTGAWEEGGGRKKLEDGVGPQGAQVSPGEAGGPSDETPRGGQGSSEKHEGRR